MALLVCSIGRCSQLRVASDSVAVLQTVAKMVEGRPIEFQDVTRSDVFGQGTLPKSALVSHMSNASEHATRRVIGKMSESREVDGSGLIRELVVHIGRWLQRANQGACARCAIIVQTATA
jgi:hypothetical protein